MNGKDVLEVYYHFQYSPQGWKEWQRIASIKVQIEKRFERVIFKEYDAYEVTGNIYTVSELGKHFKAFVKFPKPQFPSGRKESYKMLCRHAKRLHYKGLFHLEQLIATSIRFNSIDPEGIAQTVKRAISAYHFALEKRDQWKVQLSKEERHKVLSESAYKAAEVKKQKNKPKVLKAIELKKQGVLLKEIAQELEVSTRTVLRWTNSIK